MKAPGLDRQIERSRHRLAKLRDRAEHEGHGPGSVLSEALEELGQTLEELSVSLEELSATNEELAATQLEAALHARRYQDLFRFAPDGYVVTDGLGVIEELNVTAESQLGRSGRYMVGKPLLPLVAPGDRDSFLACLDALRRGRVRLEGRLIRFGSEPGFDASVSAVAERREDRLEIRWTLRDVSELRERDAFRNEIERHLASVVWLDQLDPFKVLHASGSYEKVWGRPVAALYQNAYDWLEAVHPEDRPRVEQAVEDLRRGEPMDAEFRIRRPDGEVRWIEVRGTPFRDARGRLDRAAGIAEDVTEKKRSEAALQEAERRRRKAALAAERAQTRERRVLARDLHDAVSQSLALAHAKLAALRDETAERPRVARLREVEELIAEVDRRTRTLTFQLSPPILHDLGLTSATEWLADDMRSRLGLRVQIRDTGHPVPLGFDTREAVFRSLRELLVNVARHAGTDEAWVHLDRRDEVLTVTVEDSGVGFDPDQQPAGFGLLSIRERLEALGGRLEIDSEKGRGTRARLIVPSGASAGA